MAFALATALSLPATALAANPVVNVENHTSAAAPTSVSGLSIDGVDAPKTGSALDDAATVSTAEGATWDIPVLWVGSDLQLATSAREGATYLPVLAFYVPQHYSIAGDGFTVRLSDSLVKLLGDDDTVSVHNAARGITYILPASLRDLFASAGTQDVGSQAASAADAVQQGAAVEQAAAEQRSLVEIYCAQTARNAFTDEDLERLLDLVFP